MPERHDPGSLRVTRLAEVRHWRGVSQKELADAVGMALNTYRRLELGRLPRKGAPNPPLRDLVNCAKALGVPVGAVIEPEWLQWWDPTGGTRTVPGPRGLWPHLPTERHAERVPRPSWLPPEVEPERD